MQKEIERAKEYLKAGKLVVYPTDTLYGIAANVFDENAVRKIYEVKHRPLSLPLPVALSEKNEIEKYAFMNDVAKKIIDIFMPGRITIILKKKRGIPDIVSKDKIAIRIPANEIARELARDFPVTATSANIHGMSPPSTVEEARKQLGRKVAMYIDGGKLPGKPSTIVDVSEGRIKIIREGAIKSEEIYGVI